MTTTHTGSEDFRAIAEQLEVIAQTAGRILGELQRRRLSRRWKAAGELVTSADLESHRILSVALTAQFPGVPLIMEEQDNLREVPSRCLIVDELDGTAIYTNGCPEWGISLAWIDAGEPKAGVLHQPVTSRTVIARRGGGAWLNGERIQFSQDAGIEDGLLLVELNRYLRGSEWSWISRLSGAALATRCLSTAVGSAIELLTGHALLYVNCRGAKIWDWAASALAIEEARGAATNPSGGKLSWHHIEMGAILASNESILRHALKFRGF